MAPDAETAAFCRGLPDGRATQLGELWAIPISGLALVENLRRVAARVTASTSERDLAHAWADRMIEIAGRDPKSLILVTADMARSNPPMGSSFVSELARRLQGQGAALALPLTWMEQRLSEEDLTIEQQVQAEAREQAADQVSMSNSIGSLRLLGAIDWRKFVETMSVVELRCAAIRPRQDFATRAIIAVSRGGESEPLPRATWRSKPCASRAQRLARWFTWSTGLPSRTRARARLSALDTVRRISPGSLAL